ncbi:transcriptional regulator family: C2H2 zinc finger [Penicillium brevicompactum]|uniref:Transcriptional regulator family: C2H2 zinc finger n=1 Tax=Penicillium brevicompactum TaxID=5074 RepID=A0A9W9R209_PENBR|nr:transcriptional regulator family: C2H2 zinc finger [Penicillium brevicompactum]
MSHAPFDRVSASSPLEVVEPSPSESHLQPQSSAYAQIIPHRTHSYAEPNKIPPSSVFGAHVQSQWAMSDTMHQVPETFAPIHNEFTHQFVQDIAPTFGAQNMVHTPWTNTERPDMGAFHRGYLPPSMRGAPLAMFFPRRPTEGFTPLSSPHECHDE